MLRELNIENVAVIEKANISFDRGLNILTGETGAGKSILIDSINAILGNRTTREIVRTGEYKAVIWAAFEDIDQKNLDFIVDQGYECDGTLILHREITTDGKSQCRINGKPATAATVRDVCGNLINIHGQHDNQDLLNPERHIYIIDNFAELGGLLSQYSTLYTALIQLQRELKATVMNEDEKSRRIDLLTYQIDEIEKAELSADEEDVLTQRRHVMRNSEKILSNLKQAHEILSGDDEVDGALSMIFTASNLIEDINGFSEEMDNSSSRLNELYYSLNDISSEINSFLDSFDFDLSDMQTIEERLDLIYRLKNKYGSTIEEVLGYLENSKSELENIEYADVHMENIKARYNETLEQANALADEISEIRHQAFSRFSEQIQQELKFLNMPDVMFTVNCETGNLNRLGKDTVEFFISTNPGEPPKPLSRIASGGELSRIMLSIKNALADKDNIGTLIFDEIDTGVSGTSAGKIGKKLKESAASRQTICVTHSAQIASYADVHLKIEKNVVDGRTFTNVYPLNYEQRKHELARIVSGDNVTETALQNADEMLRIANS
ncbi:MAG: DNA repair protein RecN [Oscillospiraceae bacterium]